MARPRKDDERESAKQRIEHAFWELLEEGPYRRISVRALSQRADVNHNTFYYHFESIEDLAVHLVSDNIPSELFETAALLIAGGEFDFAQLSDSANLQTRFSRFRMLLRKGDSNLIKAGKQQVIEQVLAQFDIDLRELGSCERAKLTFFTGGVSAVMTSDEVETFAQYVEVMQDGIIPAAAELLRQVIKR